MGIAASPPPSSHPCRGRQHPRVPCGATGSADGGERDGGENPPRRPPRAERPPCPTKASRRRPRHHPRYQKPAAAVPGAAGRPCAAFPGGGWGGGSGWGVPSPPPPPPPPQLDFTRSAGFSLPACRSHYTHQGRQPGPGPPQTPLCPPPGPCMTPPMSRAPRPPPWCFMIFDYSIYAAIADRRRPCLPTVTDRHYRFGGGFFFFLFDLFWGFCFFFC